MGIPAENRKICADNAFNCFGTAYIFERRARGIRIRLRILTFLGVATPAAFGAVLGLIGAQSPYVPFATWVAGIIGIIQLVGSIWSLVSNWDSEFSYYIESKSDNYRLAEEFSTLGSTKTLEVSEFDVEMRLLETQGEFRAQLDNRIDVTDAEKRMGMRTALRRYQRECIGCHQVPTSLKSTKCDICGNF
jgi:mobilome CxxCx(11)CxxC protein